MDVQWFRSAGFGAIVHWGLYSVPGGVWKGAETEYIGEWLQSRFRIPNSEYERLASQFNPVKFNADEWVRRFRDAGMKYMIFTAKHHEGFAMYRSEVSPFNIFDATPYHHDPLADLAESCEKYGVKLGLYYSQYLDWHEPFGGDPNRGPDNFGASWGNDWDYPDMSKKKHFSLYFEGKVMPQLTELLTRYGKIHVIWFDCPLDMEKEYSVKLRELVHRLQPDCLINGRIGNGCEDYSSLGDNQTPGASEGKFRMVESPVTLNDTWGYKQNDHNWKSSQDIIKRLLACAEVKANLLLNIGPKPDGTFPDESVRILGETADWHRKNGYPVCAAAGNPFPQPLPCAYVLAEEKSLHFYPKKPASGHVRLAGIKGRIVSADVPSSMDGDFMTLDFSGTPALQNVEVRFEAVPEISQELIAQNGQLELPASRGKLKTAADGACEFRKNISADGVISLAGRHMVISNGNLSCWENPDDRIVWEAFFPEAGEYDVLCETCSEKHSHPWLGGRRVELVFGQEKIETELTAAWPPVGKYYPQAFSMLGRVSIGVPGKVKISLRTVKVTDAECAWMQLAHLTVRKIQ